MHQLKLNYLKNTSILSGVQTLEMLKTITSVIKIETFSSEIPQYSACMNQQLYARDLGVYDFQDYS